MGNLGFCSQLYTAYEGLATPRAADSGIGVIDGIRKLLKRDCSVERHQEICCSPLVWGLKVSMLAWHQSMKREVSCTR